ncbi:DUF1963 domain-containing protein [Roseivirga pacifica]|uniref:DUF1963 domain-containing protein n=1 Tax=Roseivirga pacifica TaxID=1267423 RepID=UPI0020955B0C|nr:DUF1963 domain-containing protein [Roseivirga pacifica]MCO6360659.1 DUF1963 domain-containing protein [Roseivirga pacifica]MCO6368548.1 DUF1963 domain-containing protein [Roseivirga pacifica]MCO6372690.1 DUF1963 domain-containing protein [Roseivirga pacifica]MCO6376748.1 DUF1963 domain-containing protein [Roseivirga pacifica]MCO6377972.1 DUF1963 domain-containing protein [Roseivirga pacifica]
MSFLKKLFGSKSEENPSEEEKRYSSKEIEKAFTESIEKLNKFKRIAYIPKTEPNQASFSSKSKIGGLPYIRNVNDWPVCPNCKKHMQLFIQLNLNELPINKDNGLAQLFYCTTSEPICESEMEAFFPFSKSVECRVIQTDAESAQINPNIDKLFEEKQIIGWTPKDDYPHFEEYDQLGIKLGLEDDVYELMEQREIGLPIEQDKLFGWPYWVQSVEYPSDRKTDTQMELLFQLASEDNLPYMFGDVGIGYLTQSPDNKEELGFGWAC